MEPSRGGTDMFSDRRRECDDVVLGDLLDLFDSSDIESPASAYLARGLGWYYPGAGHRVCRRRFHLEPGLVLSLVAPEATHFRTGVASNHLGDRYVLYPSASLSGGNSKPLTAPRTVAASARSVNRS